LLHKRSGREYWEFEEPKAGARTSLRGGGCRSGGASELSLRADLCHSRAIREGRCLAQSCLPRRLKVTAGSSRSQRKASVGVVLSSCGDSKPSALQRRACGRQARPDEVGDGPRKKLRFSGRIGHLQSKPRDSPHARGTRRWPRPLILGRGSGSCRS
jgi:hypothetical protein